MTCGTRMPLPRRHLVSFERGDASIRVGLLLGPVVGGETMMVLSS